MDSIRVLHVDDEPSFGELVEDFLEMEDEQIEVLTETSAADGIARVCAKEERVDCIVSDYDMPGMDGLDFLDEVRDEHRDLPFVLYTGKGSEAVASEAMSKGADDYLQKGGGTEQYELLANRVRNAVEQYRSQRRAEEQERIAGVIRELNRCLVYADSVDQIEHEVCTVLSEADPYVTACIAGVDRETMRIQPRTWAGDDAGYFEQLDMAIDEGSPGRQAPGGRAYHERDVAVSQDIPDDPQYERWREAATDRGFRSLAVVPLEHDEELYGLLAVFAPRPFAFDDAEQELLSDLGDDIAHAMHARETQAELRTTASRLEALFERSPDMINVHDTAGNLVDPNPRLCEKTGYGADELTGMKIWDLDPTLEPGEARALWDRMAAGDSHRFEGEYRRRDGSTFPVEVHIRRLDIEGEARFVAISRDISDRKQREQELERYERITENLPVGVFRSTPDGEIVNMNAEFVSLFGGDSKAELRDFESQNLWADRADREALLDRLERDGVVTEQLFEAETLDGESRWVETTLRVAEEDGEQYLDGVMRDVTDRRERRRRLEQAQTMFENAQDALFLVDVDEELTVERVNPAYEAATGFSEDALRGRTPREILGGDTGAEIERTYRECIDRGEPLEYEEELPIDDHTSWETRIAPVVIDGEVEKLAGATRDITERKARERELQRNQRRFRALFEDPNILVGLLQTDGTVIDTNSTAMEYVDASLDDVTGDPLWNTPWWSDEMRSVVRAKVERAADGNYVTYEADLTKPEGEPYSVEGVIRPVTDDTERVVSLVISARDVTERTERARRLEQYEMIVETTDDIAFVVDEEWTIDLVNQSVSEYVDASPGEFEGQPVMQLADEFFAADELLERFRRTLERALQAEDGTGSAERLELTVSPNGDTAVFECRFSPLVTDNGRGAVAITMRDITERKRREERLERQNERFDELASAVSHDLQTPLEVARGRAEMAVETGSPDQMEEALTALDRVDELREDLAEVLRTKEIVDETEPVDIGRIGHEAWGTVATPDETSLQVGDTPTVTADPGALRRLFENLFSNAVEHTGQDVAVRIGKTGDGFFIEDDGPGIPSDIRDEVFTPGYSTKTGGSGVGLASVRQIVLAHGWRISVTESARGGARFEITVPEAG